MKIEILGTGCPKCKKLTELVKEAVDELGISAEILKVDKINDIMNYGVMITPALAIDGKVVVAGRIPSKDEIKKWINEANKMGRKKVLFICVHNSARSQMAEAFLNKLAGDKYEAKSAGITPGKLNPVVVEVMQETGIDISANKTKGIKEFIDRSDVFDYVITVCDESGCPLFPGNAEQIHWSFPDPSGFTGTNEEKLAKTREVRDQIKAKIEIWIKE